MDTKANAWVCRPQLELRRDVFAPAKHPEDPCPDGYWWQRVREACTPVTCTSEPNPENLKGLCRKGSHEHLNSSADWTRPISCVVDYEPANEKTGGKNPVFGGCDLCIIPRHADCGARVIDGRLEPEQCSTWRFERRKPPKKKKEKELGPLPKNDPQQPFKAPDFREFQHPDGQPSCSKGSVPLVQKGGGTVCVGGPSSPACPPGAGLFPSFDAAEPALCMPCLVGEESWVFDGRAQCLRNPCPRGSVPVPDPGLIESYSCRKSTAILAAQEHGLNMPEGRACPAAEGFSFIEGAFQCRPCGKGRMAASINGLPACIKEGAPKCPGGWIHVPDKALQNVSGLMNQKRRKTGGKDRSCLPCPSGSMFRGDRGHFHGSCLPPQAPAAQDDEPEEKAPKDEPGLFQQDETALPVIHGIQ
jgi:hypothetical protein